MIAHQRHCLVAVRALGRLERQIDRAEAVAAAVDEIAEQNDDAPRMAARLPPRLVKQRGEQIAATVNVADGEHFDVVSAGARQRVTPAIENDGHGRSSAFRSAASMTRRGGDFQGAGQFE